MSGYSSRRSSKSVRKSGKSGRPSGTGRSGRPAGTGRGGRGRKPRDSAETDLRPMDVAATCTDVALKAVSESNSAIFNGVMQQTRNALAAISSGLKEVGAVNTPVEDLDKAVDAAEQIAKSFAMKARNMSAKQGRRTQDLRDQKKTLASTVTALQDPALLKSKASKTKQSSKLRDLLEDLKCDEDKLEVYMDVARSADRSAEQQAVFKEMTAFAQQALEAHEVAITQGERDIKAAEFCAERFKTVVSTAQDFAAAKVEMQEHLVKLLAGCSELALNDVDHAGMKEGVRRALSNVGQSLDTVVKARGTEEQVLVTRVSQAEQAVDAARTQFSAKKDEHKVKRQMSKELKRNAVSVKKGLKRARSEHKIVEEKSDVRATKFWKTAYQAIGELADDATYEDMHHKSLGKRFSTMREVAESSSTIGADNAAKVEEIFRKTPSTRSAEEAEIVNTVAEVVTAKFNETQADSKRALADSQARLESVMTESAQKNEETRAAQEHIAELAEQVEEAERALAQAAKEKDAADYAYDRAREATEAARAIRAMLINAEKVAGVSRGTANGTGQVEPLRAPRLDAPRRD